MSAIRGFLCCACLPLLFVAMSLVAASPAHAVPELIWAEIAGNNGSWSTAVVTKAGEKDKIYIKYTPDPKKVGKCDDIRLVQTVRRTDQNGNLIEPKNVDAGALSHAQDDMTATGTTVDHLKTEKDPYYNGDDAKKDSTSKGSSDGRFASSPTAMSDAPYYPDDWFPAGVTSVTLSFEVCAICKDTGKILDCITWSYTRTKFAPGFGTVTDAVAAAGPTDEFKKAKEKFDKNHSNDTVCPEAVAEVHKGEKNLAVGVHDLLPYTPHPSQPTLCMVDIVNNSGMPIAGIQWRARNQTTNQILQTSTIPSLQPWSYQTVQFTIPPIPAAPSIGRAGTQATQQVHLICVTADPFNSLVEYNESDNTDCFTLGPEGISAVPGGSRPPDYARISVSPSPFRTRTSVHYALREAGMVRIEVFDAAGARVRVVASAVLEPGEHFAEWDGRNDAGRRVGAGGYIIRVTSEGRSRATKVMLLH